VVVERFADILLEKADLLKMYAVYCSNQPLVASLVKQYTGEVGNRPCRVAPSLCLPHLSACVRVFIVLFFVFCTLQHPDFASFLKKTHRKKVCNGMLLSSYLIQPMQRLCRYPLLLRELRKVRVCCWSFSVLDLLFCLSVAFHTTSFACSCFLSLSLLSLHS
jgi:RhoGEF domain